jgi:hypothetical protein
VAARELQRLRRGGLGLFVPVLAVDDRQVVSTRVQPMASKPTSASMVTPKAGRMTTSAAVSVVAVSAASLRKRTPCPRRRSLTCGLWMISPVRNTRRSGNLRRA